MTSTQESPEKPEKPDDSEHITEDETLEIENESSGDVSVLLEGEAEDVTEELLELEDFPEVSDDSEANTETFPPAEATPQPEPQSSSAWPLVFGGLVAGAIGFGAAYFLNSQPSGLSEDIARAVEGVEGNAAGLADLTATVDALGGSIPEAPDLSDLEGGIAALNSSVADIASQLTGVNETIAGVEANAAEGLSDLTSQLAELKERIAALELESGNAASAQGDAAAAQLSAFQSDLEGLVSEAEAKIVAAEEKAQAILAEAQAAAEATEAEAVREAKLAERRAALAELKTAVDGGAAYSDIVAGLDNVPPELIEHADSGVPTMVALQQTFAPAARSALATAQTVPEDASTGERFAAFLRRQTNARSLTPQDGNDTDAVLSRAEAYLSEGKLSETLSEVSALPEDAQAAMSGWLADAQTRQAALQAVDALSANLN